MDKVNSLLFQVDIIALLPEVYLALSFLVILIYGSFQVIPATHLYTSITYNVSRLTFIIIGLAIVLILNNPVVNQVIWNATFIVDNSSNSVKLFVLIVLCLCILLSEEYLCKARIRPYEIFVFFIGIGLSLCLLISSYDLLSIYLCIEFLSLIFYTLATWKRDSGFSAEAGLKYFILGSLASIILLFGASLIYVITGTTNIGSLSILFENLTSLSILIHLGFICIGSALLFKLGAAPYHMWVIDVYEGAPTLVTLIFASVPKFSILIVLCRLAITGSWSLFPYLWENLFCICGLLSLLIGCLGGLGEIKLKRVLAFSGIGHIGFLCLGLCCGSVEGLQAIFFYILIYSVTSIYMWTYLLYLDPIKKNCLTLTDSVGLVNSNPVLGLLTCLMIFSLAGIPPFAGFFAKLLIFISLIDGYFYFVSIIVVITSVLSAFYYLRLIKILYFEKINTWLFFSPLSKIHSFVLVFSSFIILLFLLNPNFCFCFSYKLGLGFFS